ncbi:aspartic peptidase domain-containing protein [Circinella umbellata]|nr:aspartic peptidase domain-containing protein [Circinella umbellata]
MLLSITTSLLIITSVATTIASNSNSGNYVKRENDPQLLRLPLIRNPYSTDILEAARRKHGKVLNKRADTFTTKLYNDQGSQYLVQVGIGTPPQNFTVTLDTGSADLWVPSSQCPKSECPFGGFKESASSTFQGNGDDFGIQYGIGSVNGTYVKDTVTVAGASVPDQQFGLAETTEDILTTPTSAGGSGGDETKPNNQTSVAANGILGLGYPQLTAATTQGEEAYNPFVFNLVEKNLIQDPVFSVYMNSADQSGWAGEIIFGGVDKSKYSGELAYLPVAQLTTQQQPLGNFDGNQGDGSSANGQQEGQGYYYWMVYGQGVSVQGPSGDTQDFDLDSTGAFILDTGTTLTYMPTKMTIQVATAIAGENGFQLDRQSGVLIVDCSVASSNAQVQLKMSQSSDSSSEPVILSVPASELVIPLDGDTPESSSACMFGIAPLGSSGGGLGSNMFLVGDSMLRSAYLVFDMGQNRVGIAAANGVAGSVNGSGVASDSGNFSESSSIMNSVNSIGLWAATCISLFTMNCLLTTF